MPNIKLIILGSIVVVLLGVLGVGGYFLYGKVEKQHEENVNKLADFGTKVIPIKGGPEAVTVGTEGQLQLPPDIAEKKLSPTEKIIIALSREKEQLASELTIANEKVERLERELLALRAYRTENERYAPLPLQEERIRATEVLTDFFNSSSDATRFNSFQKEVMALAAASVYLDILREYRLSFDESEKDIIVHEHLPAFGFCFGDGIIFVPNSKTEERNLLAYYKSGDETLINDRLARDLNEITAPCLKPLNERINAML
ncbi:hypothetical protein [Motiliproteus sediminis]|uniref:hypothetical protein n=1 Tax=Motiliproteus sediminis TaxID=1468178 RepID=UPI001AF024B8|nr:hypothetical protein [Motiliproteus sediminis]